MLINFKQANKISINKKFPTCKTIFHHIYKVRQKSPASKIQEYCIEFSPNKQIRNNNNNMQDSNCMCSIDSDIKKNKKKTLYYRFVCIYLSFPYIVYILFLLPENIYCFSHIYTSVYLYKHLIF